MHAHHIEFLELLNGQVQYVVPRWQRRYRWGQSDIERLVEDLLTVAVAGSEAAHYGGTLLTFPEPGPAGVVKTIRVVDGQQRLTTVSILLACIAAELGREGQCGDWTAQIIRDDRLTNPGKSPEKHHKLRLQDEDDKEYRRGLEGKPASAGAVAQHDMNRSELSAQLAAQFSLDRASADRMVTAVFAAIGDSLANGEAVSIAGFGTFDTKSRPARQGRNPRTGETIAIAASTARRRFPAADRRQRSKPPRVRGRVRNLRQLPATGLPRRPPGGPAKPSPTSAPGRSTGAAPARRFLLSLPRSCRAGSGCRSNSSNGWSSHLVTSGIANSGSLFTSGHHMGLRQDTTPRVSLAAADLSTRT